MSPEIFSGGSTGTWDIDLAIPDVTELQAGSYVLMDLAYRRLGLDFAHAHHRNGDSDQRESSRIRDRGRRIQSIFDGSGIWSGAHRAGWCTTGGAAMSSATWTSRENRPRLGDRLEFIPPHCDPTVNLYDRVWACRGERVEATGR